MMDYAREMMDLKTLVTRTLEKKGVLAKIRGIAMASAASSSSRSDLDGKPIKAITICMIDVGGFIGSHLCEKLMSETSHTVLALDVCNDKIHHLLDDARTAGSIGGGGLGSPGLQSGVKRNFFY
ncbi:stomatal closure-related actin-binding protein 1 [Iris pallida]|uniref:Stomatal closure-related actin-binding protein 1 n=1 Tax=Iris pallida TaxID=29817 RepID=A0AAX6HZP8_IRIPA|nr:stomatal closure-related actin-binding protein 1 [Iris pallida]